MQQVLDELLQLGVRDVRLEEPLSRHTTWKVGGPADLFVHPRTEEELQNTISVLHQRTIPWIAIGRGSNLLVRDGGIRGAVIKISDGFDQLAIDGTRLTVGGGYSMVRLATYVARQGLAGLEFAGGVPGNVGGAVYMNAGAHGSEISAILESAVILDETGRKHTLEKDEMNFSYRTSILQNELHGIVTAATFQLSEGNRTEITDRLSRFKNRRRETQPLQHPCAGSVFRNPPHTHAGKLIEEAGLKGYQIGGAQISELHGNFIINCGDAKADDIQEMINFIKKEIYKRTQIELIPEVKMIGEEKK
ncbi:UDP-N-acetylmuramate dehydrogenase [Seinonella peptonophila]|uniref:UDP-N-acetylenolpyruvoylglucosamine reductase n=1 Tax=Seinonella peptonophila TaxID=112248 RepID=A0A1M4UZE3_9BACL|nr:UDP-N-acetylmuramate dehydrogenase [Seinonella peptonophila]SHE62104.1 UDP-N-acetylmuramate dehydrogenase [Seinonella peptonophila]